MSSDILRVGFALFLGTLAIAAMVRFVWYPVIADMICLIKRERSGAGNCTTTGRARMTRREDMTLTQRIEWLESTVGVYGFLLAQKGLTIERVLKATAGNDLWLNGVNADDWRMLWDEIVPVLLHHARQRGEQVDWEG